MSEPAERALRALLGLPASAPLRWSRESVPSARLGRVRIAVGPPARELHLELLDGADSELPPWLAAHGLQLRAHPPAQDPAALTALARRLGARFRAHHPSDGAGALRVAFGLGGRSFEDVAAHHARDGWNIWHHLDGEPRHGMGLLRLGFRCNQDCGFCWQGRSWPDAPGDAVQRIDRLADAGARILSITGGEPTAYKELPALIAHARGRGMAVSLQTNAIGFARPRTLARLVDAGLHAAFVSFHSADEALSDELTRAPGTWRLTVQGIQAALRAGITLRLNCVVQASNLPGLPEHARFIRDELVPVAPDAFLGVSYSHPSQGFDDSAFVAELAPLDEVGPPLSAAATLLGDAGIEVELLGSCGFPICVVSEVRGLLDRVRAASFPALHMASRVAVAPCADCALSDRCLGPRREYVEVHGARGLRPLDPPSGSPAGALPSREPSESR